MLAGNSESLRDNLSRVHRKRGNMNMVPGENEIHCSASLPSTLATVEVPTDEVHSKSRGRTVLAALVMAIVL